MATEKLTEPGDTYTNASGTSYHVLERERWFGGIPVGEILDEQNHGVRVILVGAAWKLLRGR